MDLTLTIQEIIGELLGKIGVNFKKIDVKLNEEKKRYYINLESPESSLLIGFHGETIQALQHLLKTLLWKKGLTEEYTIYLDIDEYRKRQENSIITMAERKAEIVRNTGRPISLPPMAPYYRRLIHLHLAEPNYDDIITESISEGERRHIVLKPNTNANE